MQVRMRMRMRMQVPMPEQLRVSVPVPMRMAMQKALGLESCLHRLHGEADPPTPTAPVQAARLPADAQAPGCAAASAR